MISNYFSQSTLQFSPSFDILFRNYLVWKLTHRSHVLAVLAVFIGVQTGLRWPPGFESLFWRQIVDIFSLAEDKRLFHTELLCTLKTAHCKLLFEWVENYGTCRLLMAESMYGTTSSSHGIQAMPASTKTAAWQTLLVVQPRLQRRTLCTMISS